VLQIVAGKRDVSIEQIQAGRIVRKYDFKDWGACGRAGCRREHGFGYIVALLGGGFINIGHDCADKYADAEKWAKMLSDFDATTLREAHEVAIAQALNAAQLKQHWLDNDAKQVIEDAIALHASFCRDAGPVLLREIEKRAEKGRSLIEYEHRLTPEEHEVRRIAAQRIDQPEVSVPWTEMRPLGDLKGLLCFRPGRTPSETSVRLQRLVTVLIEWVRREGEDTKLLMQQTRELGPMTRDLEDSLRATRDFFSPGNLETLMRLPAIKSQGIITIERVGPGEVRVVRRPGSGWNKSAA
jgi:hypothetical protein